MPSLPIPDDDVIEIDEVCVRKSPSLWLWVAVSRKVGHVLGFALGDRSEETLEHLWQDIPDDYCAAPVNTDHYSAYGRFFAGTDHEACDKGTGKTNRSESTNTKWRQRHSGLVRRSCGVCRRMEDDIADRFMILAEAHNKERIKGWTEGLTE